MLLQILRRYLRLMRIHDFNYNYSDDFSFWLEENQRCKELASWTDILGVQIQTGRTGIDLTKVSIAIFLSTGYSSGDHEQAICRSYRPP